MIGELASIIPVEIYSDQSPFLLVTAGAIGLYLLAIGADMLVNGASGAALRMGMPQMVIGATIVSMGTTSPEAAVSVTAAWSGEPGLALGNAVGSIIADTALIFGLGCLMARIPADRFILMRQGWVQFGSAGLLAILCYGMWVWKGSDAALTRWTGLLLLGLLGAYLYQSVRWGRQRGDPLKAQTGDITESAKKEPAWRLASHFIGGLILVVVCSDLVIGCVAELARQWGIPTIVIASTIVAIGTSLPELVIGLTSVRKGHPELLLGNVIGADILNVLFVAGASAAAADLPIIDATAPRPDIFLVLHLPAMLLILFVFRVFIFSACRKGQFDRWQGAPLLLIYACYLYLNYHLSMI